MKEIITGYKESVDRKLFIRQRIFLVIIVIFLSIDITNVLHGKIGVAIAVSGFLLATVIGFLLARMFRIFWHEEKKKVVSQLDWTGGILLVIYMIIEIGRKWFFGHWLSGGALTSFGLIIPTGLLLGRFVGTYLKIKKILKEG